MMAKQSKLNTVEQNVRSATRALAEKRQALSRAQAAAGEGQLVQQKLDNVRRALSDARELDWADAKGTGTPGRSAAPVSPSTAVAALSLPEQGSEGAVLKLRRMLAWEEEMAEKMQQRMNELKNRGADEAGQYRRLVSLCTRTPVDQVDGVSLFSRPISFLVILYYPHCSDFSNRMLEERLTLQDA